MATPRDRIVLLFCHAGSLNKHVWTPVVRRLKAAPALQRFAWEPFAVDWRYHGAKSSDADAATIYYKDGDKSAPRVDHPGKYWPEWAPHDLKNVVKLLRNEDAALRRKTHIVGIGHSMGASSLLNVETKNPGTFAGLILFEPPFTTDSCIHEGSKVTAAVVNTLSRPGEWDTWEDVHDHFKNDRIYRRWHPESMEAFLEGGIKKSSDGKRFLLAMAPAHEASLYCHRFMVLAKDEMRHIQCKAVIEVGDQTVLFDPQFAQNLAEELPTVFSVAEPIKNTTHFMVIEDPDACAAHIAANLATFPVVQQALASSKL